MNLNSMYENRRIAAPEADRMVMSKNLLRIQISPTAKYLKPFVLTK
jgi:hypothetical protein